jgi:hypothetical protein
MIGYDQLDDEEKAQLEALFPKPQELTETGLFFFLDVE